MTRNRGFILVNALVLVAAMAAAALVLLMRAEQGRQRLSAGQEATQVALYLDGATLLARRMLEMDVFNGVDHPGEAWAQPVQGAEIDRGQVSFKVTDLQGRFNVNWLAVEEDSHAEAAFARLIRAHGLPDELALKVMTEVRPSGGGPVLDPMQLNALRALPPDSRARLFPFITALPSDSLLNVNTASAEVLAIWVEGLGGDGARRLVQQARRQPFGSFSSFLLSLPPKVAAELDDTRITTWSHWYEVRAEARLGTKIAARRTVLERKQLPEGAQVHYHLPDD